jgi:hypothetical protein
MRKILLLSLFSLVLFAGCWSEPNYTPSNQSIFIPEPSYIHFPVPSLKNEEPITIWEYTVDYDTFSKSRGNYPEIELAQWTVIELMGPSYAKNFIPYFYTDFEWDLLERTDFVKVKYYHYYSNSVEDELYSMEIRIGINVAKYTWSDTPWTSTSPTEEVVKSVKHPATTSNGNKSSFFEEWVRVASLRYRKAVSDLNKMKSDLIKTD